jgi:hypothetical protein
MLEDMGLADLEFLLGYYISRWAYLHAVEIQTIKIKSERADNIFDNPGSPSFVAEVTLK